MTIDLKDITVVLPVAMCSDFAKKTIEHVIENLPFNLVVIYDEKTPNDYILNHKVSYLKNPHGKHFTKIFNELLKYETTEYQLLINWKYRPKLENILIAKEKLEQGFGLAELTGPIQCSLYSKHLFTKIGLFDERFVGGHCVDWDIVYSMFYNDIAHYCEALETPDYSMGTKDNPTFTTWLGDCGNRENYTKFAIKWKENGTELQRVMKEKNYNDRKLFEGKYEERTYLPFSESIVSLEWVRDLYKFTSRK